MFKLRNFYPLIFFVLGACSHLVKTAPYPHKSLDDKSAIQAYSRVLSQFVNKKGQVNFADLDKNRADLDFYVSYVSKKPLDQFDNPAAQKAHLLNAYNALSMHQVLEKGIPEDHDGILTRARFFYFPKYIIGGKKMSLYSFENEVIRKKGDERVHFALNCMAVSCPRLPQKPFSENVEQELTAGAKEFFAAPTNLRVDEAKKVIYISEILKFFTEDFVPKKASSLANYVNKWVQKPVPTSEDYKVDFFEYDWTVNNSQRL